MLALTLAAFAVGLGNFGAAVSIGLSGASGATRLRVGGVFGVFEAGMPIIGLLVGHKTAASLGSVAGYAGGGLLIAIGLYQFVQAIRARSPRRRPA
jgi:putative Mn2+ efflux pump MntP